MTSKKLRILLAGTLFGLFGLVHNLDANAADKKTDRLWRAKCASCHGKDGKAQTKQGTKMAVRDMTTADWQKEFTNAKIKDAILKGLSRDKDGKKQEMKPYAEKLTPAKVDALVKYIRELGK